MLYQIKDNHNLFGLYPLSSWAPGNLVIGNSESEKNWKEELVLVIREWYSSDTPAEDIPPTNFGLAKSWKKPNFHRYDQILIQELGFLAQIPILHMHWKVLLSWKSLVRCEFLTNVSPITPGIDEMNPFEEGNLYGAIRDLGIDNKRNRLI